MYVYMYWSETSAPNVPRKVFMCEMAIRRMVSLSGLRASALHVGTMSQSSFMYVDILLRRLRSISQ